MEMGSHTDELEYISINGQDIELYPVCKHVGEMRPWKHSSDAFHSF